MKILLRDWAARNFCPAPHKNTLCTWVREGRISPAPSFIGRAYWCESDARYIAAMLARDALATAVLANFEGANDDDVSEHIVIKRLDAVITKVGFKT